MQIDALMITQTTELILLLLFLDTPIHKEVIDNLPFSVGKVGQCETFLFFNSTRTCVKRNGYIMSDKVCAGKKKVCIIGGGSAGLVSLRRVLESDALTGTIFEQKDGVGGLWCFKGKQFPTSPANLSTVGGNDNDPECWNSMYADLTCNLPYKLMELQDYPHPATLLDDPEYGTFRSRQQIYEYFRGYADNFNLWPHIQLNTAVISVRPEENVPLGPEGTPCRWTVTIHNHKDDVYDTSVFDAVMVCTGKNTYPYEPPLPGLDTFQGQVFHCKYFVSAAELADKHVVCVGLGGSTADMALHLSQTAKSVTVCHKFPRGFKLGLLPPKVREITTVKHVTVTGIISENDEEVPCDVIILGTGYTLRFPFFKDDETEQIPQVVQAKYVPHLYNMTVFSKRPSLSILNLCYRGADIILMEVQARYFVSILEGRTQLPSYSEMEHKLKLYEDDKVTHNQPYSLWFQVGEFGFGAWGYFRAIAEEIGITEQTCREWPLLEALRYIVVGLRIYGKLAIYKKDKLRIIDENTWELELCPEEEGPNKGKKEKMVLSMNPVTNKATIETVPV